MAPPRRPQGPTRSRPPAPGGASAGGAARTPGGRPPRDGRPGRAAEPPAAAPTRGAPRGQERGPQRDGPRGPDREEGRAGRGGAPGKGGAAPRGGFAAPGRAPERRHGAAEAMPRARDEPLPRTPAPRAQGGPPPGAADRAEPGTHWLYGLHAVAAALANPRRGLKRLLLTPDAEAALVERLPKPWRVQAERVEDRTRFHSFLPEDSVHQGAALLVHPLPNARLEEALAASPGPVLLLDQVTDPRNVGAILRSAAAFGAAAVVMQDRHAPPETGALARAASGALEVVPVVREVNLSRVIQLLQGKGAWVLGLAGEATRTLAEAAPRDRRAALVLGAEDSGLRRLQRETCDELVRLPITSAMESLNVAAAAAVALYELARGA